MSKKKKNDDEREDSIAMLTPEQREFLKTFKYERRHGIWAEWRTKSKNFFVSAGVRNQIGSGFFVFSLRIERHIQWFSFKFLWLYFSAGFD